MDQRYPPPWFAYRLAVTRLYLACWLDTGLTNARCLHHYRLRGLSSARVSPAAACGTIYTAVVAQVQSQRTITTLLVLNGRPGFSYVTTRTPRCYLAHAPDATRYAFGLLPPLYTATAMLPRTFAPLTFTVTVVTDCAYTHYVGYILH